MNIHQQAESAPPPQPSPPLRLELGESPLRIEMVEKPRPAWWQRNRSLLVAAIPATILILVAIFPLTFPRRETLALEPPLRDLTVVLSHPPLLGLGDSGEISLDVANHGTVSYTVRACVVFSEPLAATLPITGSTVLDFGSLEPGEGKRRCLWLQQAALWPACFSVQMTANGQRAISRPLEIPLTPVPYLRTLGNGLLAAIIAWAPLTFILQQVLERLMGEGKT
jgi:hypothetical protein